MTSQQPHENAPADDSVERPRSMLPARLTEDSGLNDVVRIGRVLAASGYFSDATTEAQGITKVLVGRELGLPAFASMSGIHIIEGRATMGANLLAAVVKRSGRYDYRVQHLDNESCTIAFWATANPRERFESTFSIEDARRAGASFKTRSGAPGMWEKYPRNMLFARALSNGVRFYCPDILLGAPVYTPEELGHEVDAEGEIIEVQAREVDRETGEILGGDEAPAASNSGAERQQAAPQRLGPTEEQLGGFDNAGDALRHIQSEFGLTATETAARLGLRRPADLWTFDAVDPEGNPLVGVRAVLFALATAVGGPGRDGMDDDDE